VYWGHKKIGTLAHKLSGFDLLPHCNHGLANLIPISVQGKNYPSGKRSLLDGWIANFLRRKRDALKRCF
jgi:hypothetical protein